MLPGGACVAVSAWALTTPFRHSLFLTLMIPTESTWHCLPGVVFNYRKMRDSHLGQAKGPREFMLSGIGLNKSLELVDKYPCPLLLRALLFYEASGEGQQTVSAPKPK